MLIRILHMVVPSLVSKYNGFVTRIMPHFSEWNNFGLFLRRNYKSTSKMNAEIHTIIEGIIRGTASGAASAKAYNIIYEKPEGPVGRNEFLFFIKPEITKLGEEDKKRKILDFLFGKISLFDFTIHDVRILGAYYLEKYDIIARHYGVINSLSREPLRYITEDAKNKFRETFGMKAEESSILGSLAFLEQFPSYTPEKLQQLWQSSATTKLSGGNYCARVTVDGNEIFLVNGFHPKQLVHFTAKGRSIVTFRLSSDTDWSVARNEFIGKTNPADAKQGSLRNELLMQKELFGLSDVSASENGFHLSAGPVEGLVELIRYGSDLEKKHVRTPGDFSFGKEMQRHFSPDEIVKFCENAELNFHGKKTSVFDLTEEKNSDEAIKLLQESRTGQ